MNKTTYKFFKAKTDGLNYKNVSLERINDLEKKIKNVSFGKLIEYIEFEDEIICLGVMSGQILIAEIICCTATDILQFDLPIMAANGWYSFVMDKNPKEFKKEKEGYTEKYVSENLWVCNCETDFVRSLQRCWCKKCDTYYGDPVPKIKSINDLMKKCQKHSKDERH